MHYIVLDFEFNQAFQFQDKRGKPDPRCPAEVIQIGAVKLDENYNEIESFNLDVQPTVYRRMHPFVTKITGITAARLRCAEGFPTVYEAFVGWIGEEPNVLCTWGGDDVKELYRNMLYHKVNHKLMTKKYINVQQLAGKQLNFAGCIGLKTAAEQLGLPCAEQFHDALNDARYTADILRIVDKTDMQTLTLSLDQLNQNMQARAAAINAKPLYAFAERRFKHKLTAREMDAILAIYTAGRDGRFDRHHGAARNPVMDLSLDEEQELEAETVQGVEADEDFAVDEALDLDMDADE